jgi:hypothetical protein
VLVRLPGVAPDDGSAAKSASAENISGRRDAPPGRLVVARWRRKVLDQPQDISWPSNSHSPKDVVSAVLAVFREGLFSWP